jgi:hypothetical protein
MSASDDDERPSRADAIAGSTDSAVISVRVSSGPVVGYAVPVSRSVDVRRGRACSDLILPLGGPQDHTTGRGWATCCEPAHRRSPG